MDGSPRRAAGAQIISLGEPPQPSSQEPIHQQYTNDPTLTTYFDYASQPPIEIRQGCVLIPIFFAVWWYWTRRAARRAVRLLITGGSDGCFGPAETTTTDPTAYAAEPDDSVGGEEQRVPIETLDHDKFGSWDDVMAQESSSLRLVRWISSSRKRAKRRMRAVTKSVMNRSGKAPTTVPMSSADNDLDSVGSNQQIITCDGLLAVDDAISSSGCSNWECIDDTAIEIATTSRGLEDSTSHPSGILV